MAARSLRATGLPRTPCSFGSSNRTDTGETARSAASVTRGGDVNPPHVTTGGAGQRTRSGRPGVYTRDGSPSPAGGAIMRMLEPRILALAVAVAVAASVLAGS